MEKITQPTFSGLRLRSTSTHSFFSTGPSALQFNHDQASGRQRSVRGSSHCVLTNSTCAEQVYYKGYLVIHAIIPQIDPFLMDEARQIVVLAD